MSVDPATIADLAERRKLEPVYRRTVAGLRQLGYRQAADDLEAEQFILFGDPLRRDLAELGRLAAYAEQHPKAVEILQAASQGGNPDQRGPTGILPAPAGEVLPWANAESENFACPHQHLDLRTVPEAVRRLVLALIEGPHRYSFPNSDEIALEEIHVLLPDLPACRAYVVSDGVKQRIEALLREASAEDANQQHVHGRCGVRLTPLCLAHLEPEPCPTCSAYIAGGL